MKSHEEMIAKKDALEQINLALRRASLLYHAFAKVILEIHGKEKGMSIIREAIDYYGKKIGESVKQAAIESNLELEPKNFKSDLPSLAWKSEEILVDGEKRKKVLFCPIADELLKLDDSEIARIYCWVDQAKTKAFNENYEFLHLKNMMDGDPYCELVVRPVEKP